MATVTPAGQEPQSVPPATEETTSNKQSSVVVDPAAIEPPATYSRYSTIGFSVAQQNGYGVHSGSCLDFSYAELATMAQLEVPFSGFSESTRRIRDFDSLLYSFRIRGTAGLLVRSGDSQASDQVKCHSSGAPVNTGSNSANTTTNTAKTTDRFEQGNALFIQFGIGLAYTQASWEASLLYLYGDGLAGGEGHLPTPDGTDSQRMLSMRQSFNKARLSGGYKWGRVGVQAYFDLGKTSLIGAETAWVGFNNIFLDMQGGVSLSFDFRTPREKLD